MFLKGEIVKPSGVGRTATWERMVGTVTEIRDKAALVQWHNVAVEDEMLFDEIVTTNTFAKQIPHHARVLGGEEDWKLLLTFYDDDEKNSS